MSIMQKLVVSVVSILKNHELQAYVKNMKDSSTCFMKTQNHKTANNLIFRTIFKTMHFQMYMGHIPVVTLEHPGRLKLI